MPVDIIGPVIRTTIAYILILGLVILIGRKLLSQITFFDFIVGVTIGATTANVALGPKEVSITGSIILVTLTILTVLTGFIRLWSFKARKVIDSGPITVIANGKIMADNLARSRVTLNELTMLLREKNIFNLNDVEFAILEADGKMSVLPKSQKKPVTPADLNIPTKYGGLMKDLIMDGHVLKENLADAHFNEEWLIGQLKEKNLELNEVFYAGLDSEGNLYLSSRNRNLEEQGQYGID
ncbi:MAG: DUF421 domain-containing protein [Bacillota bacterium]